jgi:hypothetical protein
MRISRLDAVLGCDMENACPWRWRCLHEPICGCKEIGKK